MMRACSNCRKLLAPAEGVCPDDGEPAIEVELSPLPAALAKRFPGAQPFAVGSTGSLYRVASGLLKVFAEGAVGSPAETARLKRELHKQVELRVAGLSRLAEFGTEGTTMWLLREYAPGQPLSVSLRKAGDFSPAESFVIVAQLASALDDLHRAGLLHRDIKLGHILVDGEVAQLIDAGVVSRPFGEVAPLRYVAPEVLAGKPASFRGDLYSLGCVLYRMLQGAEYELGASMPSDVDCPKPVTTLLKSLLAEDPRQRPFSAQQLRRGLDPFLPDSARVAPTTFMPPPPSHKAIAQTLADRTQEISLSEIEAAHAGDATQELDIDDLVPAPAAALPQPSAAPRKPTGSKISSAPPPPPSLMEAAAIDAANAGNKITSDRAPSKAPAIQKAGAALAGKLSSPAAPRTPVPPPASLAPSAPAKRRVPAPGRTATEIGMPAVKGPVTQAPQSAQAAIAGLLQSARVEVRPKSSGHGNGAKTSSPANEDTVSVEALEIDPAPAAAVIPSAVETLRISPAPAAPPPGVEVSIAEVAAPEGPKSGEALLAEFAQPSERPAPQPSAARAMITRAGSGFAAALRRATLAGVPRQTAPAPAVEHQTSPGTISAARRLGQVLQAKAAEREKRERERAEAAAEAEPRATTPALEAAPLTAAPEVAPLTAAPEVAPLTAATPIEVAPVEPRVAPTTPTLEVAAVAEPNSGVEIALPRASHASDETSTEVPIAARTGEVSTDVEVAKSAPMVAAAASEPLTPPGEGGNGKGAFDVESLFEDKLAPERSLPPGSNDVTDPNVRLPTDRTPDGRSRSAAQAWPMLAAAGVLGVIVVGVSARACDPGDRHGATADQREKTAEVAPAAPIAPAPAAAEPQAIAVAPAEPAAAPAEPEPAAQAPTAAAQPEAAAAADEAAPSESRTLTASQARPMPTSMRGGVVQYRPGDEPNVDHKAKGRELFSSGKYRDAADAYQKASLRTPSDAGAFAGLGASWLAAGEPERAIMAYQRALQLQPSVSGFQAALGRAYLKKGDRPRAAAAYRKALELDPQNAAAKTALQTIQN